jgi:hypothetical protein
LIWNGVGFRPLDKTVHSNQEVNVSLVALWERPYYIYGYPFKRDPDIVLVHLNLIPVWGRLAAQLSHR